MKEEIKNDMEENACQLNEWIQALESRADGEKEETPLNKMVGSVLPGLPRGFDVVVKTKEKQLSKHVGVDTSANSILEFLDHYEPMQGYESAETGAWVE